MDGQQFDRLVAESARRPTRRSTLRLLLGGLFGGVVALRGISVRAGDRPDGDGDGLFDDDESFVYGTDPFSYDSDGDGVGDGEEVYYGTDPVVGAVDVEVLPIPAQNGGAVEIGDVNKGGNAGDAIGVGDTLTCRALGAPCSYDAECCSPTVLCCFDGTYLRTQCEDVTVYGGHCL